MNTTRGRGGPRLPDPPDIFPVNVISPSDRSAAALEAAYQNEQDKRREERFFWIAALCFLMDVDFFRGTSIGICILLFLFQIALLLALAKWLGLEQVAVPLERLFNKYIQEKKRR